MVVEWDAREMGSSSKREEERKGEGMGIKNVYFLSTNLKFEASLEEEEGFTGSGQDCRVG